MTDLSQTPMSQPWDSILLSSFFYGQPEISIYCYIDYITFIKHCCVKHKLLKYFAMPVQFVTTGSMHLMVCHLRTCNKQLSVSRMTGCKIRY